ncbi:MAG: hypothetical protein ACI89J_002081 [Hyphomicrobiaceae bacterium]|jgi:hypothetical protein
MTDRFLKTIRFDASDTFAFPLPAAPDEWAISGGFAFADLEADELTGKTRQAFANGLLGLTSFGRTTFTAVANITADEREHVIDRLARHLIDVYGAPDMNEARTAAAGEIAFIDDLVKDTVINTLFCVSRSLDDDGQIVENFRKLERRIDGGPIYLGEEEQQNGA